jgi:hypothetical protein
MSSFSFSFLSEKYVEARKEVKTMRFLMVNMKK